MDDIPEFGLPSGRISDEGAFGLPDGRKVLATMRPKVDIRDLMGFVIRAGTLVHVYTIIQRPASMGGGKLIAGLVDNGTGHYSLMVRTAFIKEV